MLLGSRFLTFDNANMQISIISNPTYAYFACCMYQSKDTFKMTETKKL